MQSQILKSVHGNPPNPVQQAVRHDTEPSYVLPGYNPYHKITGITPGLPVQPATHNNIE